MFTNTQPCDIGHCLADPSGGFAFQPPRTVSSARDRPRPLNAVLEWQDVHDGILRQGDLLAYLRLHFDDPDEVPNVVQAALTPTRRRQMAQVDNVTGFGRNVGPMFAQADARRPARLLTPKRTGCPEFS